MQKRTFTKWINSHLAKVSQDSDPLSLLRYFMSIVNGYTEGGDFRIFKLIGLIQNTLSKRLHHTPKLEAVDLFHQSRYNIMMRILFGRWHSRQQARCERSFVTPDNTVEGKEMASLTLLKKHFKPIRFIGTWFAHNGDG